jgi:hypothetical protein
MRYRERLPYRKLKKELTALGLRAGETDSRRFYISLLDALRRYMDARYEAGCTACTTRELEAYLERNLGESGGKDVLLDIFRFGDEVKFGGRPCPKEKRLRDLGQISAAALRLEAGETRHAQL